MKIHMFFCFPTTPSETLGLGCSHFARHYSGNRVCFLFLQLLRCFSSLSCLFLTYEFSEKYKRLPYSGISGSLLVSSSPKRFVGSTPFIVSRCLGIHPTPYFIWPYCWFMRVFLLVHEPLTCFLLPGVLITGGDKRTRTADICLARAALYQLSYTPS